MSRFEEFVAKVNEGGELSDELGALVAESGSVSGDALIRLASSHGIDLSLDELRTAFTGAAGSELSEDELEAVAGGTRPYDHIGNFNFKVEIEGVTVAAFKNR